MTVLQSLIKEIDENWEEGESATVDMIRSWLVRELENETQQIRDAWAAGEQKGLSHIDGYGYEKSDPNEDTYITSLKSK